MFARDKIHPQYITDEQGLKTSIIIPISEYEALLQDVEDLAAIADRREEPSVSHESLIQELKQDGLL